VELLKLSLKCNGEWVGQSRESCSSDFTLLLSEDMLRFILGCNKTLLPLLCLLILIQGLKEQWNSSLRSDDVRERVVLVLWEVLDTCNASAVHNDSGLMTGM